MTKKIIEYKIGGKTHFEFINLNSYENFFLLSHFLVHEMKANFKDSYNGIWFLVANFELNDLEIALYVHDDFEGPFLVLRKQNPKQNKELRNIANHLLQLIKLKSKYFTSRTKQKQLINEFSNKNKLRNKENQKV